MFFTLTISVGSSTSVLIPVTIPSRSSGGFGGAAGFAINGETGTVASRACSRAASRSC